ncbi:hypothetical protein ACFY7C_19325 [Streptomyces sp. NPDC012769]|uniref:hypothetical protein n=1 Tax=Streptomyces sp. NPDC012769 TaxID=3364848 RepID=UPI0036871A30
MPAERYLSWNPTRKRVWTEHPCFPKGAVRWRDDRWEWRKEHSRLGAEPKPDQLRIYRIHEGGDVITEIPPEEWDDHV